MRREASGWTHEIQTNHIPWETSGPLGATFQGHGQKLKGFILAEYAWKIILLHSPPLCINATFLRLSSWFIDKTPPTFYGLWTTRHGVANGMETSWLPTGGGGTVSPISSLCGTLLSDKRSCTTPDLSHVLLIARRATQDNRDVFGRLCVFVWAGGASASVTGCILCSSSSDHMFVEFISFLYFFCLCSSCSMLHSQSMKACAGLEEQCCVPVSGCGGSGSRLFSTLRP